MSAVRELGIGRFLEPATRKMLGQSPSKEFALSAWTLAQEASKPVVGKGPAVVEKDPAQTSPKTAAATGWPLQVNNYAGF